MNLLTELFIVLRLTFLRLNHDEFFLVEYSLIFCDNVATRNFIVNGFYCFIDVYR